MSTINNNVFNQSLNIGDKITIGRTEYTIVAEFEDTHDIITWADTPIETETEHLYVGRKLLHGKYYEYSHIIRYDKEQGWMLRS